MFNRPALGVYLPNKNLATNDPLYLELHSLFKNKLLPRKTDSSEWWIAWYWFSPNDWLYDTEAWEMIYDGKMVEKIIEEVDFLYEILAKNHFIANA